MTTEPTGTIRSPTSKATSARDAITAGNPAGEKNMTEPVAAATSPLLDPAEEAAQDRSDGHQIVEGMALCLSGGGYRAMLFHLGSLWRLNELGLMRTLGRVSSVSGGSITAAVLGFRWGELSFDGNGVAGNFESKVVEPVRDLAERRIDVASIAKGLFSPGSIADKVAKAYDKRLFDGATLQDLPDDTGDAAPRFVLNATNIQSGALWRFSRPYMGDWRVGRILNPTLPLADAVAASSAFPPVLSPMVLRLNPNDFGTDEGNDLTTDEYRSRVVLSDGGVYDNMGIETAWKRYETVLVSDAGGKMRPEGDPKADWAQHSVRVLGVIDNQVRSLRKRQVIHAYRTDAARKGAYWGIRTDIANYGLDDALPCPHDRTLALADTKTRLDKLSDKRQESLINWGYAVCDAAMRRHVAQSQDSAPGQFPYPNAAV